MKKIIIVSGGMDSVTLLHDITKQYGNDNVIALTFNYGSKHNEYEIPMAKKNCELLKVEHHILNIMEVFDSFDSALLKHDNSEEIPEGHYEDESMKKTIVPFRNGILLSIAVGFAESKNADEVFYGAHNGDHVIYPDCRRNFMDAFSLASQLGTYKEVAITAPYWNGDKGSIIKKGIVLGVDYKLTHTCYNPTNEGSCGKCGSCQERLEAFKNNEIEDPIKYR